MYIVFLFNHPYGLVRTPPEFCFNIHNALLIAFKSNIKSSQLYYYKDVTEYC